MARLGVTEGAPCPTCGAGAGDNCRLPVGENCRHPSIVPERQRTLDGPESVTDALVDLMQVCSEQGEDFDALLDAARMRVAEG